VSRPALPLAVEAHEVPDAETHWEAWNARCAVSHHEHFVPWRNASAAFHRLTVPRHHLRVALLSSGGVYVDGDVPFDLTSHAGDDTARWIPSAVDSRALRFAHDHYDHTDADRDPNCVFPIDRLRELAAVGSIGAVASRHVGFMGFIPDPGRFVRETVPHVVAQLASDGVHAAVLSPG
jgi:D-proline reductase (dithiol) PrdB